MKHLEEFKEAFRATEWYSCMRGVRGMSDGEIFEMGRTGSEFYKPQTNDAYLMWTAATARAARIVVKATGIPKDAENPTRDHIVLLGEEISERILK